VVAGQGLSSKDLAMIADYRDMTKAISNAGLMRHDPSFYLERAAILAVAMAVIVYGVVGASSLAAHMLSAVGLGLWWIQVSFIGHDAGHNSITGDRSIDSSIGYLVGNTLTGISIGWWKVSSHILYKPHTVLRKYCSKRILNQVNTLLRTYITVPSTYSANDTLK